MSLNAFGTCLSPERHKTRGLKAGVTWQGHCCYAKSKPGERHLLGAPHGPSDSGQAGRRWLPNMGYGCSWGGSNHNLYRSFKLRYRPHLLARADPLTGRWEEPWPESSDLTSHQHLHKLSTCMSPPESTLCSPRLFHSQTAFSLLQVLLIALYFPLCLPFLQIHGFERKSWKWWLNPVIPPYRNTLSPS